MSGPLFECQDCGTRWSEEQLWTIKHVFERVMPGEPMPAGECSECGALCHEVKPVPERAIAAIFNTSTDTVMDKPHEASELIDNMVAALTRIRNARDYCAEHGNYPEGWLGEDQSFDDWAADIAETVLAQVQS